MYISCNGDDPKEKIKHLRTVAATVRKPCNSIIAGLELGMRRGPYIDLINSLRSQGSLRTNSAGEHTYPLTLSTGELMLVEFTSVFNGDSLAQVIATVKGADLNNSITYLQLFRTLHKRYMYDECVIDSGKEPGNQTYHWFCGGREVILDIGTFQATIEYIYHPLKSDRRSQASGLPL